MKKAMILVMVLMLLAMAGCNDSEEFDPKLNAKIVSLENELNETQDQLFAVKLEKLKLEQALAEYDNETIPNLKSITEKAVKEKFELEETLVSKIKGYESYILAYKSDIKDIFLFLDEQDLAPVYVGEKTELTDTHIQIILDYYSQYSQGYEKGKSLESIYDPLIYPIRITPTQVGYTSQYEESFFYNVATYHTLGIEADNPEDCRLRCSAAVDPGLWETYIFEIARENGLWKIVYMGFGG